MDDGLKKKKKKIIKKNQRVFLCIASLTTTCRLTITHVQCLNLLPMSRVSGVAGVDKCRINEMASRDSSADTAANLANDSTVCPAASSDRAESRVRV